MPDRQRGELFRAEVPNHPPKSQIGLRGQTQEGQLWYEGGPR